MKKKTAVILAMSLALAFVLPSVSFHEPFIVQAQETISAPKLTRIRAISTGIKLSWKPVSKAKGYKIYRKDPKKNAYVLIKTLGKNARFYIDQKAPGGGRTAYAVTAYRGISESKRKGKAIQLVKRPSTPILSGISLESNGLKLSWKKVRGADGYDIYRKTGKSSYKKIASIGKSGRSYLDTEVSKNQTYTYTVKAFKKGIFSHYRKSGISKMYADLKDITNTSSCASIEADVTLSGTGTGYHAKLVACTPTSAVSFGIQYDKWGEPPYTDKTMFLAENVFHNQAGGQAYPRMGEAARKKTFHLMLTVQKNGTCEMYVDGSKVGSVHNPELANEPIALRVEASARLNHDTVQAEFENIKLKNGGSFNPDRSWRITNFDTNPGVKSNTSQFSSSKKITIGGKVTGLRADQDWDNAYDQVSGIVQFS